MQSELGIRRAIRSYTTQIGQVTDDISTVDQKIEELKRAKKQVEVSHDKLNDLTKKISKLNPGDAWQGKRRIGFNQGIETKIPDAAKTYGRQIDGFEGYIEAEINRLKSQRGDLMASLFSAKQNLNRMHNALKRMIAER